MANDHVTPTGLPSAPKRRTPTDTTRERALDRGLDEQRTALYRIRGIVGSARLACMHDEQPTDASNALAVAYAMLEGVEAALFADTLRQPAKVTP